MDFFLLKKYNGTQDFSFGRKKRMKNGWNLKFAGIAGAGILAVGIGIFIMDNGTW